jgi:hypothetical protein
VVLVLVLAILDVILVVLEFVIVLIIVLVGRLADSLVCYEYKDGSNKLQVCYNGTVTYCHGRLYP